MANYVCEQSEASPGKTFTARILLLLSKIRMTSCVPLCQIPEFSAQPFVRWQSRRASQIRQVKSASPEVAQPAKKSGSRGRPSISPVLFIFLPSHNDFKQ